MMMMTELQYDGTFDGWLTAVFEIYEYKFDNVSFSKLGEQSTGLLFAKQHLVRTDSEKSARVYKALKNKLSRKGFGRLYQAFLSENVGVEKVMWDFTAYCIKSSHNIEGELAHPVVWNIREIARSVGRETHRMKAFVRFKLTRDGLYYAVIEPESDVLPLISLHFESRYADQRWLIYDVRRKYGLYYNLAVVEPVEFVLSGTEGICRSEDALFDSSEVFYQQLWKTYFSSVNINARNNLKLHLQKMPKRYWKYLIEKS